MEGQPRPSWQGKRGTRGLLHTRRLYRGTKCTNHHRADVYKEGKRKTYSEREPRQGTKWEPSKSSRIRRSHRPRQHVKSEDRGQIKSGFQEAEREERASAGDALLIQSGFPSLRTSSQVGLLLRHRRLSHGMELADPIHILIFT